MSKEKTREPTSEEAVAQSTDAELLGGIKLMGSEIARRRAKEVEARRARVVAVCVKCGQPFTAKQYADLEVCPVCGGREAIRVREDKTVE